MDSKIFANLDYDAVKYLLSVDDDIQIRELLGAARQTRDSLIGNKVFIRGLIEYSNLCSKNCFYCGIRAGNNKVLRYEVPEDEVLKAAVFAWKNNYGSLVLQSGERSDSAFTSRISELIRKIHLVTENNLRITLSCGEQHEEIYRKWFDLGVKRYLLRIESSDPALYHRLHPRNAKHSYYKRLEAINSLIRIGYQAGTGVMIGLPFQTMDDLAADLFFIRDSGVHMVGMGPYIEHADTPLFKYKDTLSPPEKRVELSLKMIAILRLLRPEINIASSTALQTLDPQGREKGLLAGANVMMPNITPVTYKKNYDLYEGKPGLHDEPADCGRSLAECIRSAGCELAYGEWGDSAFYIKEKGDTE
ncbi:MAG TPA: [FeFe] hydrogenase H-cluster radical SAM maturase HydE [Bacteroidales bacterium]|nr:[FeFe] hydrogenase H-cluster radical SAM maturase HydE [Bacteroidales bacterium]